jgi:methionine aminopeptidase
MPNRFTHKIINIICPNSITKCFSNFNPCRKLISCFFFIAALDKAIALCVAGADVSTVCGEVDSFIEAELLKVFSNKKSKKLERGIGFPCCISVNNVMGHFSPTAGEESLKLENENVVKIELGAHIDGYASQAAHTIVVGGKSNGK